MKYFLYLILASFSLMSCGNKETEDTDVTSAPEQTSTEQNEQLPKTVYDSLSRVLQSNPNNVEAYLARAEFMLERGQYDRAETDVHNAWTIDSTHPKMLEYRGRFHLMNNRSREAKDDWIKCARLHPENVRCRTNLARLYLAVENYSKALTVIDEAISNDNKDAEAYFIKGLIVRDHYRDTALALQYFQNSVDLKQDFVEGLDMMGVMLAQIGDTLAKYYYQRVLELEPNRADIYYKLGVFHMDQGNLNRAMENYSKALQLNPKDADSYFNMGYIHVQLREFQKARDYFTKAIQSREKNYKAYYGRGYSLEMLGDVINARKDYRAALLANPIYKPASEAIRRIDAME